ncbi:MAG: hypothetical protein ACI9TA_000759 [Reinekea sp.]|jgi:hypothetical protein
MAKAPQQADLFLIPLLDGTFCVSQIVDVLISGSCLCAISKRQISKDSPISALSLSDLQALILINSDAIETGVWAVNGFEQLPQINSIFKWRDAKLDGYANLERQDPAVIEAFANATFGLYPWDGFGTADFFVRFLINPDQIPSAAILTNGAPA